MTNKHKVLNILSKPMRANMNLGDKVIEYWEVKVLMGCEDAIYESLATFATEDKAIELKVGATFDR